MKTLTVFILCLAVCMSTTDLFAEIRESDFGATLTQTIELQLKSKDNVGEVIAMVKEERKQLRNEQEENASAYKVVADACRADFDGYDRRTDSLEAVVTKNKRLAMIDGPVFEDRTSEKANRESELAARTSDLAAMNEEDAFLKEVFSAVVEEHNAVRSMMH